MWWRNLVALCLDDEFQIQAFSPARKVLSCNSQAGRTRHHCVRRGTAILSESGRDPRAPNDSPRHVQLVHELVLDQDVHPRMQSTQILIYLDQLPARFSSRSIEKTRTSHQDPPRTGAAPDRVWSPSMTAGQQTRYGRRSMGIAAAYAEVGGPDGSLRCASSSIDSNSLPPDTVSHRQIEEPIASQRDRWLACF